MLVYNNISYRKDYYTIAKLTNSRKQDSVVYEICCFISAISYFSIMTCPFVQELL